jgi:nitrous oxidase accessory protein NosD
MEPVVFGDREGGLWLSYANYRALERNVIALREYAEQLEIIIEFFMAEE